MAGMRYLKFRPCELLKPFVECYFVWQSDEVIDETLVFESPPSGFCSIVINSGDYYFLQNKKYEYLQVPKQFVAGQSIYNYKLFVKGHISSAGIVLKPTALASLFQLPAFEFTEERISLNDTLKTPASACLIDKIQVAPDENEKVKLLEEFALFHYNQNKPQTDYIDYAANLIVEKNGMVHIADIMKDVYMSRRNFERRFFKKVGLSPKYYARLRRMSFLTNLIAGKRKVDWPSLFSQCEFYDQSHFIKDFKEFTGRSPQQYLEENTVLANFVARPGTNSIRY
jgi:AraC-like DNA-binding protein